MNNTATTGNTIVVGSVQTRGIETVRFGEAFSNTGEYTAGSGFLLTAARLVTVATPIATSGSSVVIKATDQLDLIGGSIDTNGGRQSLTTTGPLTTDAAGTDMTSPNIEITAGVKPGASIGSSQSNTLRVVSGTLTANTSAANQDQFYEVLDENGRFRRRVDGPNPPAVSRPPRGATASTRLERNTAFRFLAVAPAGWRGGCESNPLGALFTPHTGFEDLARTPAEKPTAPAPRRYSPRLYVCRSPAALNRPRRAANDRLDHWPHDPMTPKDPVGGSEVIANRPVDHHRDVLLLDAGRGVGQGEAVRRPLVVLPVL